MVHYESNGFLGEHSQQEGAGGYRGVYTQGCLVKARVGGRLARVGS